MTMTKRGLAAGLCMAVTLATQVPAWAQDQNPTDPEGSRPSAPGDPSPAAKDARDTVYYPGDTERLKPLVYKLGMNVWLDQKEIWTSPFHMRKRDVKWWILFGGATAALIATDRPTSTLFENSRGQVSWGNHLSNIGAGYTLAPLVAGFYGYGALAGDPKARETGVLGGEALLDGLIVMEVLKLAARRNRPDAPNNKGEFLAGGSDFPSGHAIESWALASVIAHEYQHTKWVPVLAYGLAGVVSAARFTAQQHYASDIVCGGAMGWFIGRFVYQTHMDHAIHQHAWLTPRMMPQVDPGSRTYGV